MYRFGQTAARIGTGAAASGCVAWVLWPSDLSFLGNSEAIFFTIVSFATWIATEIKYSEEVELRNSAPNDIRLAKRCVDLYRGDLGFLLRDHNVWDFIEMEIYGIIDSLMDDRRRGAFDFQNSEVQKSAERLFTSLKAFRHFVALHTVPDLLGDRMMVGLKPFSICHDQEYERRRRLADEGNKLSNVAWEDFNALYLKIKKEIPEALD